MKRQVIFIPEHKWTVHVYYDTTKNDVAEVLSALSHFGCSKKGVLQTYEQMRSGSYNSGVTYSDRITRQSVMCLGRSSSFPQFLNSFVHELHHLVTHIARADGLSLEGEDICYLAGGIAQTMYPILMHYISYAK